MIIFGFDFDNTIINYDKVFYLWAKKKKLIKKNNLKNKEAIKRVIIKRNKIKDWIKLQSEVYSKGIHLAKPNKEFVKIFKYLQKKKVQFYIVSHKTKYPYYGKKINLHKLSYNWLRKNIFNKKNNIKKCNCYFENSQKKKVLKIKKLKITHFVDDLQKVLNQIPNKVTKILYKNKNFKAGKIKKLIQQSF